ncbi:hypothetical protein TRFO_02890 [Tritrichomonas foetus]|uniref:Uncharacterized protein n=1 Tax=Tritrichomonas foetus TaxID=1144522 RepID=A0A1J4KWD2_9EUKA|nr:hypothetical protein TRFO_02890 [Tritrichomonas foetus]|eukprot:OHT15547.1 hypothetical protein TRFO_02890 [Tritrichomonas foetus]
MTNTNNLYSYEEDTNEAGSPVLNSILDSRIEQIEAITLPSDQHRKDIIQSIKDIKSYPKRLSSFLDYLIDYTYTLNLELGQKQDQINELTDQLSTVKKGSLSCANTNTYNSQKRIQKIANLLDVHESSIESEINSLKKCSKTSFDDDYKNALNLVKSQKGNLAITIQDLISENQKLKSSNSELLTQLKTINKSAHSKKYRNENVLSDSDDDDDVYSYKQKPDMSDLKEQFNQIETDLAKLKNQVQNKFSVIHGSMRK